MRYIDLTGQLPPSELVDRATKKYEKLATLTDMAARKAMLNKRSSSETWGAFKAWLLGFSHGKCWFSDTLPNFAPFDVEHFRPKSSVSQDDGTKIEGYWWLAFDWTNYRICGKIGNTKKGIKFPLMPGCQRAQNKAELIREQPVLLDPIKFSDTRLVGFNIEGEMIPSFAATTAYDKKRVEITREEINLDFPNLVAMRKAVIQNCDYCILKYIEALENFDVSGIPMWETEAEKHATILVGVLDIRTQLSSIARYHLLTKNDPRLACFLI